MIQDIPYWVNQNHGKMERKEPEVYRQGFEAGWNACEKERNGLQTLCLGIIGITMLAIVVIQIINMGVLQ